MISHRVVLWGGNVSEPKISFNHWFATELGWDGGNIKISVNGGAFNQIPALAIEVGPYNNALFPAVSDGDTYNSNPLADQDAFTGIPDDQTMGSWEQSHINIWGLLQRVKRSNCDSTLVLTCVEGISVGM